MTRFYATECLPPTPPERVPDAIAVAMARYDINATDDWNPVGEWDWWGIQVHPKSPYLVRPAYDGDHRLLTAATVPAHKADLAPLGPLQCHGGPRGLLDFAAMRQRAVREHDALRAACPLDRAKEEYLLQPLVREVAQRAVAGDPHFGMPFLTTDTVACFALGTYGALRRAVQS